MHKIVDGQRVEMTPEEIAERQSQEKLWQESAFDREMIRLRTERNKLLYESDWTQLPDADIDASKVLEWKLYRQNLRDITKSIMTAEQASAVLIPSSPTTTRSNNG